MTSRASPRTLRQSSSDQPTGTSHSTVTRRVILHSAAHPFLLPPGEVTEPGYESSAS